MSDDPLRWRRNIERELVAAIVGNERMTRRGLEALRASSEWPSVPLATRLQILDALGAEPHEAREGDHGLTREQILTARRAWQDEGPPADYRRALTTRATWYRRRKELELTPWPEEYRERR